MSNRTRLLFDKVIARHILTGLLKLAEGRDLSLPEVLLPAQMTHGMDLA